MKIFRKNYLNDSLASLKLASAPEAKGHSHFGSSLVSVPCLFRPLSIPSEENNPPFFYFKLPRFVKNMNTRSKILKNSEDILLTPVVMTVRSFCFD